MAPESRQTQARFASSGPEDRKTLGRLAGGVAHDLNNLLTAITGYADLLLLDLAPGDPRRAQLQEIKDDASEAARVVRKLVSYGGQAPTRRRNAAIPELLDGLEADVLRRRGGEVRILVLIEAGGTRVRVDPRQIREIIDALVDNALEAMPDGGILLVRARPVGGSRFGGSGAGDPDPSVCIEVADNGTGMERTTLSRAFEPYFSTKSGRPGRGLELAAARQLAKQNGGTLHLESEPGRGTTARLVVPAARRNG